MIDRLRRLFSTRTQGKDDRSEPSQAIGMGRSVKSGDSSDSNQQKSVGPSDSGDSTQQISSRGTSPSPAEVLAEIKAVRHDLAAHDQYVHESVAKEVTVGQLIQALQNQLKVVPSGSRANLEELKRMTDNHKRLLGILAADPTEYYDYQQLAAMTRLSADGVRGMISELGRMGYRFRKMREGKRVRLQLIPSDSSASAIQPSDSNDSTRLN